MPATLKETTKIFLQLRVPITSLQISKSLTVLPVKPPIYIPLHKNLESRAVRMRNRPKVSETNEVLHAHFAQTQLDSEKASSLSAEDFLPWIEIILDSPDS